MTQTRKHNARLRTVLILTVVATAAKDKDTLDYCQGCLDAEMKRKTLTLKQI